MNADTVNLIDKIIHILYDVENHIMSIKILKIRLQKEDNFNIENEIKIMEAEGICRYYFYANNYVLELLQKGKEIVFKYETYANYLRKEKIDKENLELQIKLANSNIEANEVNKKNSRINKIGMIINITLALINALLLIWQILSDCK